MYRKDSNVDIYVPRLYMHADKSPRPIDLSGRSYQTTTMPPRLNKRQLREQEELSALRLTDDGPGIDFDEMSSGVDKSAMVRLHTSHRTTRRLNHTPKV